MKSSNSVWGMASTSLSSVAAAALPVKQVNRWRVLFYDDANDQVAKSLSQLVFAAELPMLYNPTKHDENADWVMYSVEGCSPEVDLEDVTDGLMPRQIRMSFESDISNKLMIDLYELSANEPFTMSLQYLDDSDVTCEVLTFQEANVDNLVPTPLNMADSGPCTTDVTFNFEIIIHSLRK